VRLASQERAAEPSLWFEGQAFTAPRDDEVKEAFHDLRTKGSPGGRREWGGEELRL
jgi:hypothetical protein